MPSKYLPCVREAHAVKWSHFLSPPERLMLQATTSYQSIHREKLTTRFHKTLLELLQIRRILQSSDEDYAEPAKFPQLRNNGIDLSVFSR